MDFKYTVGTTTAPPANSVNLAQGKMATQSSTYDVGVASRAVDGNTNGNWGNNSVTHTVGGNQEWWQVDLGGYSSIQNVNVWNRTDCCGDRLSNFYIFVSNDPFTSNDVTATQAQAGVSSYYTAGQGGVPTSVAVNRSGRYVRVQLAGNDRRHTLPARYRATRLGGELDRWSGGNYKVRKRSRRG